MYIVLLLHIFISTRVTENHIHTRFNVYFFCIRKSSFFSFFSPSQVLALEDEKKSSKPKYCSKMGWLALLPQHKEQLMAALNFLFSGRLSVLQSLDTVSKRTMASALKGKKKVIASRHAFKQPATFWQPSEQQFFLSLVNVGNRERERAARRKKKDKAFYNDERERKKATRT